MKKKYILVLDLEAEISEKISTGNQKKNKHFNELLKEVLKNDRVILEIFRLWLLTDLKEGNFIFEMDKVLDKLKEKKEIDIIRPVLKSLPEDTKVYFQTIFEPNNKKKDEFFNVFFGLFGKLKVKKLNFITNAKK